MLISGNPGNCNRGCFLQKGYVVLLPRIGGLLVWDHINLLPGYWLSAGVHGAVSQSSDIGIGLRVTPSLLNVHRFSFSFQVFV